MLSHAENSEITGLILETALLVHRELGPGLLESVYECVLAFELRERGLHVQQQVEAQISYRGSSMRDGFRVDLLVEDAVVVELKSAQRHEPVFAKQLLTYLRLLDLRVGLLINFGTPLLKDGFRRLINDSPRHQHISCALVAANRA